MKREHREPGDVVAFEEWWPSLVDATHAIISGGKGSGKTTMVRAVMLELARQGAQFVMIDPHHKRGEWGPGITPLAAGRRFDQARVAFAWGNQELDQRYKARADQGTADFPLIVFVVDEFDLFTDKRPDVGDDLRELAARFLSMIGDESRKVGIRLIVIAHGTEVRNLGLEGRGKKRTNYTIVELQQGPNQQPEPTGTLRIGSTTWTIDTRPVLDLAAGQLQPDMLVQLPEVQHAEDTSTDPIVLQRRIAALEQQLRSRPVAEPVLTDDQIGRLEAAIQQLVSAQHEIGAILRRVGRLPEHAAQPAQPAQAPRAAQPAQPAQRRLPGAGAATRSTTRKTTARPTQQPERAAPAGAKRRATPTADDEIAQMLAIPAIAARVERVRRRFASDKGTQGYVLSTLRLLWRRTLRPIDIAEGRGATSPRTIERRTTVCQALAAEGLLLDKGEAGYTVNHAELERLQKLAQAIQ